MNAANPQFAKFSRQRTRWTRSVEIELALERKAIGRRIARLRVQAHLTQEAAADRAGVSTRGYQKWEAGEVMPNWPNLEQLAEVFKVTVDDIIGDAPTHARAIRNRPVHDLLGEVLERLDRIEERQVLIGQALLPLEEADEDVRRFFERPGQSEPLGDDEEREGPEAAEG